METSAAIRGGPSPLVNGNVASSVNRSDPPLSAVLLSVWLSTARPLPVRQSCTLFIEPQRSMGTHWRRVDDDISTPRVTAVARLALRFATSRPGSGALLARLGGRSQLMRAFTVRPARSPA